MPKITALAPAVVEVFTICKAEIREGNRKRIEWQVTPSETQEASQAPAASAAPAPAAARSRPESVASPVAVSEPGTMTQIMGGALIAAIDSLAAAAKYAADKHGWKVEFNEEDIRATAYSVFIQFWKDRETRARYPQTAPQQRVNGGTQWQQ